MRQIRQSALLFITLALTAAGCTTLPDVKPFADSTAGLAAAAGTHYREVASDVASLKAVQMLGEKDAVFQTRKKELEDTQRTFEKTDKNLDTLFAAMTTYSEKLASLVAAGKTGAESAQSLLDSVQGFAELASTSGFPVGAAADPITKGFKAIADEFTKMQAKNSLKDAIAAAEPGVKLVAEQFEVIYGEAINQAANGIRNNKRLAASDAAGPNIIGFNDNVEHNYNAYYRFLNSFVTNFDSQAPESFWRGFCRDKTGPCQAIMELEAVGLVEARMEAIRPIVEAYKAEIMSIETTLKHRRSTSKAVIKAVQAWALEHQKLRRSLEDGTSLSAFNLKAALIELGNLVGQKP
ncbi:MAG: hypothetical protein E8D41_06945 [Nitrospira sp.]|nr:MAG: hypothetical protein E8D41_06945 [Nitrospira sp.]